MPSITLPTGETVQFDEEDRPLVEGHRWFLSGGYARATAYVEGRKRTVTMHRLILEAGTGQQVDHVNRDKLDNRRANLRLADPSQQKGNTAAYRTNRSGYKGVSFHRPTGTWQAQIQQGSKRSLGRFRTPEEAARAYDRAAVELFGEFACTNDRLGLL